MTHREAGPGMPRREDRELRDAKLTSPWWYDYNAHEIVRYSDGRRWSADEVPELVRSLRDLNNPEVDVDELDRWVREQPEDARG